MEGTRCIFTSGSFGKQAFITCFPGQQEIKKPAAPIGDISDQNRPDKGVKSLS